MICHFQREFLLIWVFQRSTVQSPMRVMIILFLS
ncbi:hypothetical protein NP493_265g00001 [Ridgeia piscesae]|uniref:Uncharacterized protein n=1 Tax=Ridgeia piscesae TaxID=27915 RepID=A0AAD9NXR2_RIDPI|nr:hypothetical protein NP493_265g00001 [Ridgeia piscesae]